MFLCAGFPIRKIRRVWFMPQYQSSEAKAENNRSSAYTLLAVGGVGFIAVLLIFFNVIPVYRNMAAFKSPIFLFIASCSTPVSNLPPYFTS